MTVDQEKLQQLVEKMLPELSAGYGGVMMSIGDKLGLYQAMLDAGPMSAEAVAEKAGCAPRYVREWLNSQVAGGVIEYHPDAGTYELTPEQAMLVAHRDSPFFLPHGWQLVATMWADEEKTLDAFRTGKGIHWGNHDDRLYCSVAEFFRNSYRADLVQNWLPALDGVVDKLEHGARVADVGCGYGYSTVMMAEAYPNSRFFGFDVHEGSIEAARRVAEDAGVADRVTFEVAKANDYPENGYDLVTFFDCLHDMGHPVDAAAHAARALDPDGAAMLIEPLAGDRVEDNINPVSRMYYAASTTLCCAHAISEDGTHALGAQAGPARLSEVLHEAGFNNVRRATESPFNMVIEARL